MIDTGTLEFSPCTIDENISEKLKNFFSPKTKSAENYAALHERLLTMVDKCKSERECDYLIQDYKLGNEQIAEQLHKTTDPEAKKLIRDHAAWVKSVYEPALKKKKASFREAKNESSAKVLALDSGFMKNGMNASLTETSVANEDFATAQEYMTHRIADLAPSVDLANTLFENFRSYRDHITDLVRAEGYTHKSELKNHLKWLEESYHPLLRKYRAEARGMKSEGYDRETLQFVAECVMGLYDPTKLVNESSSIKFVNDEGNVVPKVCPKCGSKVGVYLQGEPVFLCSNKKCKEYFGTVPFNESVSTDNEVLYPKNVLAESVGERHVFYRISESEMFQTANRMSKINGQEVINVLPRMVVSGQGFQQLTLNDLDSTVIYELFESNRYKISCRPAMKKLLMNGSVVMVYGDEYRIPVCIPYIVKRGAGNSAAIYVNITPFCTIDQYGKVRVGQIRNYSGLMAVLFSACVAYSIVRHSMSLPADLNDGMILLYSGMMTKVINGLVHADSIQKETIRYLSAEFALVQMYGTETGMQVFQRIKNKYFPKLGNLVVNSIDDTFNVDSFDNMTLFVEELKRNYPIMKGLSVAAISERWMRNFGSATALSLDYLGYHLYTLCMLLFESPLISRMTLEPLIDQRRGADAFKRMQTIIENEI